MCATCGCSSKRRPRVTNLESGRVLTVDHDHPHDHDHDHPHAHDHAHDHGHDHTHDHDHHDHEHGEVSTLHVQADPPTRLVKLEQEVLAKNDLLAQRNRGWFEGRGILAVNLMSSPGSGKTTLLERTIRDLGAELTISVIEGDQETLFDAERIRATGCRVVQINTGSGCHLDAEMMARGLRTLDPPADSILMIENVGNLVCPALFDLGERHKVVIMSITEGEDKPLKYPHMFRAAGLMLLNKIDLEPYLEFDIERCIGYAKQINPDLEVMRVSATRGEGLDAWYSWLRTQSTSVG
ncbi:MAG: hydrogenase nickel incorporation protein HypB [Egibacteraceae bacterium]